MAVAERTRESSGQEKTVDLTYHNKIGDDHSQVGFWPYLEERKGKSEVCDMFDTLSGQRTSKYCGRAVYRWAVYQVAYAKGFKMQPGDVPIYRWHLTDPVFTRDEAIDAINRLAGFLTEEQRARIVWPTWGNEPERQDAVSTPASGRQHAEHAEQAVIAVTVRRDGDLRGRAIARRIREAQNLLDDIESDLEEARAVHGRENPEVLIQEQAEMRRRAGRMADEAGKLQRQAAVMDDQINAAKRRLTQNSRSAKALLSERGEAQDRLAALKRDYRAATGEDWSD